MEWVDALRGSIVGLDTAPLIYFIEENPLYVPSLRAFFGAVDQGYFRVVTSIPTLTEPDTAASSWSFQLAADYRRILLHANNMKPSRYPR